TPPDPTYIYTLSLHDALPILKFVALVIVAAEPAVLTVPVSPIYPLNRSEPPPSSAVSWFSELTVPELMDSCIAALVIVDEVFLRSEERRVGKECRSGLWVCEW